jgi:hypothetical protein
VFSTDSTDNSLIDRRHPELQATSPTAQSSGFGPRHSVLSPESSVLKLDWRVWLPVVVLIVVAIVQVVLAKTAALGPWKGGGFGMFATTDGSQFRRVRIFVEAPDRSEELEIAPSQEFAAARAQLFPSDSIMTSLARAVVAREQRYGRPVHSVRLEVWRTEFSPGSLAATDRPLRTLTLYSDQSDAAQGDNKARQ